LVGWFKRKVPYRLDKKFYHGKYLFTIDWAHPDTNILDTEHSEIPQEHKCAHILALDNGNFAAQPNNRLLWHVNSYTTDNSWPDYKVQTTYWDAEESSMVTEDSDKMFYEMKDKKSVYESYKDFATDISFENEGKGKEK
jgi:uncharacterized membrane protein (UPF0182 family)